MVRTMKAVTASSIGQYEKSVHALSSLQRIHNASTRYALLLIFRGMDAAGKDGATIACRPPTRHWIRRCCAGRRRML